MPLGWDEFFTASPLDFTLRTVPAMFAARGDAHAAIDDAPGSIDSLLALFARQAADGQADAPLPPYAPKEVGEPPRVAASRARSPARTAAVMNRSPGLVNRSPRERLPVITIAQAKRKVDALAGLERWKVKYPRVVAQLAPEHILIDANRGKSSAWYRVRINLKNVPVPERPPTEDPDPDYDWKTEWSGGNSDDALSPEDD
jgi:hypothetical protein